jgi:hypothetical protein
MLGYPAATSDTFQQAHGRRCGVRGASEKSLPTLPLPTEGEPFDKLRAVSLSNGIRVRGMIRHLKHSGCVINV